MEYGTQNRVLGPVIGFFGEVSQDVHDILDLAAEELAKRHLETFKCSQNRATAIFKNQLQRKWGHSVSRGWSRLILSRLRNHVDMGRGNSSTHTSDVQEVNHMYAYHSTHRGRGRNTLPRRD